MTDRQIGAKRMVAAAALDWLLERGELPQLVGIGSGSTVACLVEELAARRGALSGIRGLVAASEASAQLLRRHELPVIEAQQIDSLEIYMDGADQVDPALRTIKGGGGALAREKLLATASEFFLCLCDDSKRVDRLEGHPVPLEVLPSALRIVSAAVRSRWGNPVLREDFVTDNGNRILDVHDIRLTEPLEALEMELAALPGVLDCGLFARRRADLLLVNDPAGTGVEAVAAAIG